MNIIDLPVKDIGSIAQRLRDLADAIEEGHFGDAHNVAWVIDCGGGKVEVGFLGRSPGVAGADAHLLLGIGLHKLQVAAQEGWHGVD